MANNCWYCRKGGIVDLYFAGRTGVCPICRSGVNVQFDVGRFVALDNITTEVDNWVKGMGGSEPNEPLTMAQLKELPDGVKLYSYTDYGKQFEAIVTVDKEKEWIKYEKGGHNRFEQSATDGKDNRFNRRLYLKDPKSNGGNSGTQREYKVGDRVITEEGNIKGFNDKVGVITEIDVTYEYPYLVDIDGQEIWCKVKCLVNDDKPLTLEELKQMDGQKVWLSRFINGVEKFDDGACGWWTVDAKNAQLNKIGSNSWDRIGNIGTRFGFNAYRADQSHRANEEEIPF